MHFTNFNSLNVVCFLKEIMTCIIRDILTLPLLAVVLGRIYKGRLSLVHQYHPSNFPYLSQWGLEETWEGVSTIN